MKASARGQATEFSSAIQHGQKIRLLIFEEKSLS